MPFNLMKKFLLLPAAKARSMSASQRAAAVSRKKKAERKTRKNKRPNYART